jgi:hypothetical protein
MECEYFPHVANNAFFWNIFFFNFSENGERNEYPTDFVLFFLVDSKNNIHCITNGNAILRSKEEKNEKKKIYTNSFSIEMMQVSDRTIEEMYHRKCAECSDIGEHLPILYEYAKRCITIVELGMRNAASTWALLFGLHDSPYSGEKLLLRISLEGCSDIDPIKKATRNTDVRCQFVTGNNTTMSLLRDIDLLFVDSWHVYGQLKRELATHAHRVRKYIVMHDTEVDASHGETIRCHMDAFKQSLEYGIPEREINRGIRPAIEEFLTQGDAAGGEWRILAHYPNCNGLTVLERSK